MLPAHTQATTPSGDFAVTLVNTTAYSTWDINAAGTRYKVAPRIERVYGGQYIHLRNLHVNQIMFTPF